MNETAGKLTKNPNHVQTYRLLRMDTRYDDESFHRNLRGIASAGLRNLISSSVCMILIEVIEKRGEGFAREEECRRLRADDWWDISVMRVLS